MTAAVIIWPTEIGHLVEKCKSKEAITRECHVLVVRLVRRMDASTDECNHPELLVEMPASRSPV